MMMKKCSLLISIFCILTLTAVEIQVPVRWKASQEVSDYRVSEIGVSRKNDKFILAVRIKNLNALIQHRFLAGVYLNTDNDINTGRFPGQSGIDLQFNSDVYSRTMGGIDWQGNKRLPLTLYEDDYLIETAGDVLYLVVRAEALKNIQFSERMMIRLVLSSPGFELEPFSQTIDMTRGEGTVLPPLNFIRFGSVRETRRKSAEAVLIRETPQYRIWNSFGERFSHDEPLPVMTERNPTLEIKAARREKESVHLAVTAAQPLKQLEAAVTPLVGPDGFRIGEVRVQYPGFVGNDRGEIFTDILYERYKQQNSTHHFVMLTLNIPSKAPAGIYRGRISLKLNGEGIETIPLELEVYDFELPETPGLRTAFSVKRSHIGKAFKNPEIADRQYELLLDLCREYRISPRLVGTAPQYRLNGDKLEIDWREFDRAATNYFDDCKFTVYQPELGQLGSHDHFYRLPDMFKKNMKAGDPLFNRIWTQYIRQLCDHHREHGWFDKMLFVIWDEPYTVWDEINLAARTAKEVEPKLPIGVFIDHYEPAIAPNIDVWLFGGFAPAAYMRHNKALKEKRIWVYNSGGMDNFRIPASDLRAYYWLAEKYRLEGYLNSEINSYPSLAYQSGMAWNRYPAHLWMYPDAEGTKLRGSLRLVHVREGLDDYDYLSLYRDLLRKHGGEMPRDIAAFLPVLKPDGEIVFATASGQKLLNWRDRIAREIVRLKNR